MKWAIQSNLIKYCPVTVMDVGTAIKVWGPSIAMLKDKTVRTTPILVRQDVIEIPKEIWELHKDVTLTIDIIVVNKIPFFVTYSLVICYTLEQQESFNHLQRFEKYVQLLPTERFSGCIHQGRR